MWSRRSFLRAGGLAAIGRLRGATKLRITRYELISTRVPMDERVREAWQRSFFRQGRFQTHYQPVIVRLFSNEISVTHVLEDDLMLEPFTMKNGFYEVPRFSHERAK